MKFLNMNLMKKTRESKLEIDKEKFTEQAYDAIMKNKMTKEMMPDVIKYSLKYEDLEIDKDDLER